VVCRRGSLWLFGGCLSNFPRELKNSRSKRRSLPHKGGKGAELVELRSNFKVLLVLFANRHQIDTRSTLASLFAMEDSAAFA
jgi:hypothetical protein